MTDQFPDRSFDYVAEYPTTLTPEQLDDIMMPYILAQRSEIERNKNKQLRKGRGKTPNIGMTELAGECLYWSAIDRRVWVKEGEWEYRGGVWADGGRRRSVCRWG